MPSNHVETPNVAAFERETAAALGELRTALSDLIAAVQPSARDGQAIERPIELQRALNIPGTLAWQMWKIAHSADPLLEARNLPGPHAIGRLLEAAELVGIPDAILAEVHNAHTAVDELIRTHAGSRAAFHAMIGGLRENGTEQIDLNYRRTAFTANSHIWGIQARVRFATFIYFANPAVPDQYDAVGLRGLIGLKRLRLNASCVISSTRVWCEEPQQDVPHTREPLDEQALAQYGAPIWRAFSSQPQPPLRVMRTERGMTNIELSGDAIGNRSAVTCVLGEIFRGAGNVNETNYQCSHAGVQMPCELLVQDVLVEKNLFGSITPRASLHSDLRGPDQSGIERENERLPMQETVQYLGRGLSVTACNAIPGYREMIKAALERVECDPKQFDVYRCRIEFPVLPSTVMIRIDFAL